MTRDIFFRGKRKDTGEWIEGYFFKIWDRTFILWGMTNGIPDMVEVIPETVSQFTSLTDIHKKKIFDGDIVAKGFELYEVRWNPEQVRWGIYSNNFEVAGFTKFSESYFEVIGNIYDNKELLENDKDKG